MKTKGFTITEVVIVTGIIGLIAILTMPTFISNQKKLTYSKALQVGVVNFESAMSNIMVRNGVDDLLDLDNWNSNSPEFTFMVGRGLAIARQETINRTYQPLSGSGDVTVLKNLPSLLAKNGVEYIINTENVTKANQKTELEILQKNSNYTNKAADVYIDINGEATPNIYGRDLFRFELGVDGILYPYHGHDYNSYNNRDEHLDPEAKCKDGYAEYCAAYLMSNNYEMDY